MSSCPSTSCLAASVGLVGPGGVRLVECQALPRQATVGGSRDGGADMGEREEGGHRGRKPGGSGAGAGFYQVRDRSKRRSTREYEAAG